jgi:hypothetical protein
MSIKSINMNQNEETLVDYLESFTLFKQLLQFETSKDE